MNFNWNPTVNDAAEPNSNWVDWLLKHKKKIYAAILLVVGMLGGNVDRINGVVNSITTDPALVKRVDSLEFDVNVLKGEMTDVMNSMATDKTFKPADPAVNVETDAGTFKWEKPNK